MKSTSAFALALVASAALSGCGQTGPLYMPQPPAKAPALTPPPGMPVTTATVPPSVPVSATAPATAPAKTNIISTVPAQPDGTPSH